MRVVRGMLTAAVLLVAMTLPSAASASSPIHSCANFKYDGIIESHVRVEGVTCAYFRKFADNFYDHLKTDGWTIRQYHPGTAVGNDIASRGSERIWFYISGHENSQS